MAVRKKILKVFRTIGDVQVAVFARSILAVSLCLFSTTKLFALGNAINPINADQVITVLEVDNISPKIFQLKERLEITPNDEDSTRELINEYLLLSKKTGDERYLGYAMAIVNYWPEQTMPESIQLLQARIIQRQHHFAEALQIVNRVLELNPRSGEAYLLAAYIYMAQGELEAAVRYCSQATRWLGAKEGINCSSRVQGLSGQGEKAFQILRVVLNEAADIVDPEQTESYLNLAEIATRLGKEKDAEKYFRFAIDVSNSQSSTPDPQAISGLADLLLSQNRYQECIDFLQAYASSTQLPLIKIQIMLAKAALGREGEIEREQLENYFELEQLRNADYSSGDRSSGDYASGDYASRGYASRDFARYLLEVENNPEQAFTVALDNWQTQREPDDLLVLVKSAQAANKYDDIADVLAWRNAIGLEDQRLDTILSTFN